VTSRVDSKKNLFPLPSVAEKGFLRIFLLGFAQQKNAQNCFLAATLPKNN